MKKIFILVALISPILFGCMKEAEERHVVEFGTSSLRVEIADTPEALKKGLMFRESLDEDSGMLFVFERPSRYTFWMKDTSIPLSIAFLNREGKITRMYDMEPLNETKTYPSPRRTLYAIEVNQGWFDKNGITVGGTAKLPALEVQDI